MKKQFYLVTTPWWLRAINPSLTWRLPNKEKKIYLTFDDGPHETATPFVLEQLKKFGAKATFFCIGKNVVERTALYERLLNEGHATGNHSHNHLNGWKTDNDTYINNIYEASKHINSSLFRPPYGRISRSQAHALQTGDKNFTVIMWSVLSADFDTNISPEKCSRNVIANTKPGSIIVFHDSTKAYKNMSFALPVVLEYFSERNYTFEAIKKS